MLHKILPVFKRRSDSDDNLFGFWDKIRSYGFGKHNPGTKFLLHDPGSMACFLFRVTVTRVKLASLMVLASPVNKKVEGLPQGSGFLVMFLTANFNNVERLSLTISNELFPPGESDKWTTHQI